MKPIRRYKDAKDFLFKQLPMFQRIGPKAFKKDLKNIVHLLKLLGNPENKFSSIHIAGTNGKGSVAHFIAAILVANGLRVGIYTSPHYLSFRERIKIDGKRIPKKRVRSFVNKLIKKDIFKNDNFKPSFFEISVAMAFDYFGKEQPDIVIVETGLGGRLDSTNVITPLLSVITNIGLDHTNFLGNTLKLIATEKAGIIKEKVPVIIGKKQKQTTRVFEKIASQKNTKIVYAENMVKLVLEMESVNATSCNVQIANKEITFDNILMASYQEENIRTAISAVHQLQIQNPIIKLDRDILSKAFTQHLPKLKYYGRFQLLSEEPFVIADSAHNIDGIKMLFSQLEKFNYKKLLVVYGTVSDKDVNPIIDFLPAKAEYFLAKAKVPRAMDEQLLYHSFKNRKMQVRPYESVSKALKAALKKANSDDIVLITGSVFVVAEVIAIQF